MNEREYIALIDPFKNKLFRFAKRFLVSVEEAEDATQDVLLKLWNFKSLTPPPPIMEFSIIFFFFF